jgi:hypothetical protein
MLHYDADMLLYQAPGTDWTRDGLARLMRDPRAAAVTPRVSAPFASHLATRDSPSLQATHPDLRAVDGAWRIGWFSARCFLVDLQRLRGWGRFLSLRDPKYLAEVIARRWLVRGYPPAAELMIHKLAIRHGGYRLDLETEDAFVIHPNDKGPRFLRLLPGMLRAIAGGRVPDGQRGWENIVLDAWEPFLLSERAS